MTGRPFDAVLVIAFGGPEGPADIRPFLANVLRGRRGHTPGEILAAKLSVQATNPVASTGA